MKRIIAVMAATAAAASAFTVECLPTHAVFFPGLQNQPCLRIKVTAKADEEILSLSFTTGKTTLPCNITKATLSKTNRLNQFSPNAVVGNRPEVVASTDTASAGIITFNTPITLNAGDNYFWLSYDVAANAKGGNKIGAECIALVNGDGDYVMPVSGKNGAQGTPGKVYEFKYRIAPYHRARFFANNSYGIVNANHFKYATDYIIFGLSQNNGSLAYYGPTQQEYNTAVTKAKQLRGKTLCHIICGFAISENTINNSDTSASFGDVLADGTRRKALAKQLANHLVQQGFQGIDIDYEYPKQSKNGTWDNFAAFLADLREEMAGTGMSLSIAVTTRYDAPIARVNDQCDFVHLMSYGAPGDHETQQLVENDVAWARGMGIPNVKIIPGLGFFSRDRLSPHSDNGGIVYSGIIEQYPNIAADVNTFINKKDNNKEHYFNGANMIKSKCQYVIKQKLGGVLIWAYDGDVPMTNSRSLSKAMYSVIKQTKR